jgi:large subunit ribosomal protein L24
MSIAKIQTGDTVKVIAGNYKGTAGQVTNVVKTTKPNGRVSLRVAVSTVPQIVKFRKGQRQANVPGQMLSTDRLLDVSNVSLVGAKDQVSKVQIVEEKGKKVRKLKKGGAVVVKKVTDKPEKAEKTKAPKKEKEAKK